MILWRKCFRFAALSAALGVLAASVAASADAGLRDTIENARDTAKCASKAVLQPLKTVARGIKHFEDMSGEEYEREADKSMKEVMKECLEASENIMARSFGVEKVAAKARKLATSAKSAADEVSKWFDGKKKPREDGRMALSVGDEERKFYGKETGVLGGRPLPASSPSPLDEDIERLFEEKRQLDAQDAEREAGDRSDTSAPAARAGAEARWQATTDVWDEQAGPGCGEDGRGCGEEYWNKELQAKASRLDPWAALRERDGRNRDGAGQRQDDAVAREAECADPWVDCPGTPDIGSRRGSGSEGVVHGSGEIAPPDHADSPADYTDALASLLGERRSGSDPDYRSALEKMEAEARRRKQREEAKRARERAAKARAKSSAPSRTESARSRSSASDSESRSDQSTRTAKKRLSSNCDQDIAPACKRAISSAEMMNRPLEQAAQSGRMSLRRQAAVLAQTVQNALNAARTCVRVEPRPHCKATYRRVVAGLERTHRSALRRMRSLSR